MRYISLFSGVGGLEHPTIPPVSLCEIDKTCHTVLQRKFHDVEIVPDVTTFRPKKVDAVIGGFPCQDISSAGKMAGLAGKHSSLFYEMIRIGCQAQADHFVAENVPHLIRLRSGALMQNVINQVSQHWPFVAWRCLNAREFGLPQNRNRVIIVASRCKATALNLFRPLPIQKNSVIAIPKAAGFYTTAGTRSICYSIGYVPAVKVGSSLGIPTPPGIHFGTIVRKATAGECIALQGFKAEQFFGLASKDILRQMGNAVPMPMGSFAVETVTKMPTTCRLVPSNKILSSGFYDGSLWTPERAHSSTLANNLESFLEYNQDQLSERAASGLLRRLQRSGTRCPDELYNSLSKLSQVTH
jgi:DNA (cytosine-5)-methyltransferase 1